VAWLFWAVPLVALTFLFTLNDVLRGSRKKQTEFVLTNLIFGCIGLALFLSGWKLALVAIAVPFIMPIFFRFPAVQIVHHVMGYPDLGIEQYAQEELGETANTLRKGGILAAAEAADTKAKQRDVHMEACVSKAMKKTSIQDLLQQLDANPDDLRAMYRHFSISKLPTKLRQQPLLNTKLVHFFIERSVLSKRSQQYNRHLESEEDNIHFGLWVRFSPDGASPR